MLKGIDFSFGGGVTTAQIKAAGYQFVCRYLSGGNSKDISAAELANYKAAGIPVIFVWETTGVDMTSKANGVADATAAQAELARFAVALKDPSVALAPVFFAADAATEVAELPYMQGVNSVIGKARTGIYGGIGTVSAAFNAGVAAFGWQTAAWSNGQWDSRALLRQLGQVQVGPATCDVDEAAFWASTKVLGLNDDFGQWPRPSAPAPVPVPVPSPPPVPVPAPAPQKGVVISITTRGAARVTSLDGGHTWKYGGTKAGSVLNQKGYVVSLSGGVAHVYTTDGGLTWKWGKWPF